MSYKIDNCQFLSQAPLADWGGSELIIRFQTGSIPVGRIFNTILSAHHPGAINSSIALNCR